MRFKTFAYIFPGFLFLVIGLSFYLTPSAGLPGTQRYLLHLKDGIGRLEQNIANSTNEAVSLSSELSMMPYVRRGALSLSEDGAFVLRERLDNAATKSQLSVRTVGDIQVREIVPESLKVYEVNFVAESSLKAFLSLVKDFENVTPRVYWRSLTLRSNMSASNNEMLIVSATVSLIAMEPVNE